MRAKQKLCNNTHGFTLIELLVVIAIIGMLSSVVLTSLNYARAKARDARKQADFHSITNALYLFYDANGRMPKNINPCCAACESQTSSGPYEQSMQELVNAGFLSTIPKSPGGGDGYCGGGRYGYYDYGPNNSVGAFMATGLETAPDTTTGIPPSCRPWGPGVNNWCDQSSSKEYCICNPY